MPEYIYQGRRISSTQELTPEQVELYGRAMLSRESVQQGLQAGKTDKDMQSQLSALSESGLALRAAGGSTPGGTKPKMDYLANKSAYGPTITPAKTAGTTAGVTPRVGTNMAAPGGALGTATATAPAPTTAAPSAASPGTAAPGTTAPRTAAPAPVNAPPVNVEDPNVYQRLTDLLGQTNQQVQNFDYNFQPSETPEAYRNRMMAEIERQIGQRQREGTGAIEKSRGEIQTEADIARRGLQDVYRQQSDELTTRADEIRQAYGAGRRNIEAEQAEKLPEFQSQKSQADVQAAKSAKNIMDYMARKGLAKGGQAVSELAGIEGQRLGMQQTADIGQQKYMRDVSGRIAGLEEQQAGGLADVQRMQGRAMESLSSGERNIIERVNSAMQGLSIDEKNLLDQLSDMRMSMESEIDPQYKDMTRQEKSDAFNQMMAQAGFASQNIEQVRGILDDIQQAKQIAHENEFRERQFTEGVRQFDVGQQFGERQFEEGVRQFNVGQQNWQQQMTFNQQQAEIENALREGQMTIEQANAAIKQAELDAINDPNSLDNRLKQAKLDEYLNKGQLSYADLFKAGQELLQYGGEQEAANLIINSNLSEEEQIQLLNQLGIDLNILNQPEEDGPEKKWYQFWK